MEKLIKLYKFLNSKEYKELIKKKKNIIKIYGKVIMRYNKLLKKVTCLCLIFCFCMSTVCATELNNTTNVNNNITDVNGVNIEVNNTVENETLKTNINNEKIIEDNLTFIGFSNNAIDHIENNNSVVDKYGEIRHENVDWFNEVDPEADVIALQNGLPLTVATIGVAAIGTACGGPVGGVAATGLFLLMVTLTQISHFI